MPLKLNISEKGKTFNLEVENEVLAGKSIADTVKGEDINSDLGGYELKITGGTDFAGFPMTESVEGIGLKGLLLKKGWGMKDSRKGLRLKKTVRGKTIADSTMQVNLNVEKVGEKGLGDVFGKKEDGNKEESVGAEGAAGDSKEEKKEETATGVEGGEGVKAEAPKVEAKAEEKKEVSNAKSETSGATDANVEEKVDEMVENNTGEDGKEKKEEVKVEDKVEEVKVEEKVEEVKVDEKKEDGK